MTLETAKRVVDYCLLQKVSGYRTTLSVNLFGGEPSLRTERLLQLLPKLTGISRGKQFVLGATTNGTLANDQVSAYSKKARFICW